MKCNYCNIEMSELEIGNNWACSKCGHIQFVYADGNVVSHKSCTCGYCEEERELASLDREYSNRNRHGIRILGKRRPEHYETPPAA